MFRPCLALDLGSLAHPGDAATLARVRGLGFEALALEAETLGDVCEAARIAGVLATEGLSVAWLALAPGSDLAPALDLVRVIGTRDVVVRRPAAPIDAAMPEREWVARLVSWWRAQATQAAESGCRLLWDVEPQGHLVGPNPRAQILRDVAAANLGVVFDSSLPGWLDRFRGSIGGVRWRVATEGSAAERLVPSLVDAWLPCRWWVVDPSGAADPWRSAADAAIGLDRLLSRSFPRTT